MKSIARHDMENLTPTMRLRRLWKGHTMRTWVVAYRDAECKGDVAVVVAPTYTMAVVEFMISHPNCDYIGVLEVVR